MRSSILIHETVQGFVMMVGIMGQVSTIKIVNEVLTYLLIVALL